jgi:hypothetical protein
MQEIVETQRWRKTVIALSLLIGVPYAAWTVSQWILGGRTDTFASTAVAIAAIIVGVNILNDWRFGIYLFIPWLLFEDVVRKYLGNSMYVYFAKDFLVGVTYVSFFFHARKIGMQIRRPPFFVPFIIFFWLGFIQIFNPNSPSFWYGLLGFKLYFYYMPLFFIGYALLRSEEDLRKLLVWNLSLAGVISLIGIIQATVSPGFLSPATLAPEIAELGRLYRQSPISGFRMLRPTGVFVSDGRFAAFLQMMWLIGLGSVAFLVPRLQRGRRYVMLGLALVAVATVLSGSRSATVFAVANALVLAPAFLRGAPQWQRPGMRKVIVSLRRVALVVGLSLFALAYFFPQDLGARWALYAETLSPASPDFELGNRAWSYPIAEFIKAFDSGNWVIGHGIGTASLGVGYVALLLHKPLPGIAVESGFGCLVLEMGFLAPLLWLIMAFAILRSAWKALRSVQGSPLYPVAFSIFWFSFILLIPQMAGGLSAYQNYIVNAYFWLLLGILFKVPELAAQVHADDSSQRSFTP